MLMWHGQIQVDNGSNPVTRGEVDLTFLLAVQKKVNVTLGITIYFTPRLIS
jgi:hypothetical protein